MVKSSRSGSRRRRQRQEVQRQRDADLRHKTKFLIVIFGFYYSIFLGISSILVDYKRRRIHKKQIYTIIAACSNVVLIGAYPFAYAFSTRMMQRSLLGNQLALYTGIAKQLIVFVTAVFTVAQRFRRERRFIGMTREFFAIDSGYFDRQPWDETLERHFDHMFFVKFFSVFAQPLSIIVGTLLTNPEISISCVLLTAYYININCAMHSVMFHYFFALWSAYKRFAVINVRLAHLLDQLKQLEQHNDVARVMLLESGQTLVQRRHHAATDLQEIAVVHLRLTRLMMRYNKRNKVQMMVMLLVHMLNMTSYGYYGILILNGSLNVTPSLLALMAGVAAYILLCVDLYFFISTCGGIVDCHRQTAEVLKQFHALPSVSVELEQQCELFSTQLLLHRLTISLGGFLELAKSTALTMVGFIMRHTIIMVQFDLETRFRQLKEAELMAHMENLGLSLD